MNELIPIVISCISLCVAIYGQWQISKKNKIDKSKIRSEIVSMDADDLTSMYPSMENENSKYFIRIGIMNSGYKKEVIEKIKFYFGDKISEIVLNKEINGKSNIVQDLELKRFEVIKLKKLELFPMEDKKIIIPKSELKLHQRDIELHVKKLEKEWKGGKRIG